VTPHAPQPTFSNSHRIFRIEKTLGVGLILRDDVRVFYVDGIYWDAYYSFRQIIIRILNEASKIYKLLGGFSTGC
jgi:hypothetical protein